MRTLKIQIRSTDKSNISPSDIVNIELSGRESETELKELFSCLVPCDPNEIKGIKDSENNYYTLSSVISNKEINSKKNKKIYQLVVKDKNLYNRLNNETEHSMNLCNFAYVNKEDQNSFENFYNGNLTVNGFIRADSTVNEKRNGSSKRGFEGAVKRNLNNKFVNYSSKMNSKTRNFFEENQNEFYNNKQSLHEELKARKCFNAFDHMKAQNNSAYPGNLDRKIHPLQCKNYNNNKSPYKANNLLELGDEYEPNKLENLYNNNRIIESYFAKSKESNKINDFKGTFRFMANAKQNNDLKNYMNLSAFNRSEWNKENSVITEKKQERASNCDSKSLSKLKTQEKKEREKSIIIKESQRKGNRRSSLLSVSNKLHYNNGENKSCFISGNFGSKSCKKSGDCCAPEQAKTELSDLKNDFLLYLKKLYELKIISDEAFNKIRSNYEIRNKDFLDLYKIRLQGILDENSFLASILKLADKASVTSNNNMINFESEFLNNNFAIPNKNKKEPFFNINNKQILRELINHIDANYFDHLGDMKILSDLIERENELVILAFESYLKNNNYSSLLINLKSILNKTRSTSKPNLRILNKLKSSSNKDTSETKYCNHSCTNPNCDLERYISSKSKKLNEEMRQLQYSPVRKNLIPLITKNSENLHNLNFLHYNHFNNNNNNYNNINFDLNLIKNKNCNFNNTNIYCTPKIEIKTSSDKNTSQLFVSNNNFFESTRTESKTGLANQSSCKKPEPNPKPKINYEEVGFGNGNPGDKKENKILNFINYVDNVNIDKNNFFEATLTEKNNVLQTNMMMTLNSNASENLYFQTIQYTTISNETNEVSSSEKENDQEDCKDKDIIKVNEDGFRLETQSSIENSVFEKPGVKSNDYCKATNEGKQKESNESHQSKQNKDKNLNQDSIEGNNINNNQIYSSIKCNEINDVKKLNNMSINKSPFNDSKESEIKIIEFKKYLRNSDLLQDPKDFYLLNKILDEKPQRDLLPFIDEFLETNNTSKLKKSIDILIKSYISNIKYSITISPSDGESISEKLNLNENENSFESAKNASNTPIRRLSTKRSLIKQKEDDQSTYAEKESLRSNKKSSRNNLKTDSDKKLNHIENKNDKKKEDFENVYNSTLSNLRTKENDNNVSNNTYNHQITFSRNPDFSCDRKRNYKSKSVINTDKSHDISTKVVRANFNKNRVLGKSGAKFTHENHNNKNLIYGNNQVVLGSINLQKKFEDIKKLKVQEETDLLSSKDKAANKTKDPLFSFNDNLNNVVNKGISSIPVNNGQKTKEPAYLGVAKFKNSEEKSKQIPIINSKSDAHSDLTDNASENIDSNFISRMDSKENILIFNNISSKIIINNELHMGKATSSIINQNNKVKDNNKNGFSKEKSKEPKEEKLNKSNKAVSKTGFFGIKNKSGINVKNPLNKTPEKSELNGNFALKEKYTSLKELLYDLENSGNLSHHQYKYILSRYEHNEETILSAWEVYQFNYNLEDLIENLKAFSVNVRKPKNLNCKGSGFTPSSISNKKREIISFLQSRQKEQRQIIIEKQINIIELLAKENLIESSKLDVVKQLIVEENLLVISAFENLSVAKDFWDFAETIALIADNYFNFENGEKKSDKGSVAMLSCDSAKGDLVLEKKDTKEIENEFDLSKKISCCNLNEEFSDEGNKANTNLNRINLEKSNFKSLESVKEENDYFIWLKNIFSLFIQSNCQGFNSEDLLELNKKFEERNEFLMSSVEFYAISKDEEEFLDNLKLLIKN